MPNKLLLLTPVLFVLLFNIAFGQPPTNEQVVISAVKDATLKQFQEIHQGAISIITGKTALDSLFSTSVADAMRARYSQVMIASGPNSALDNLTINILGFEFKYKKGSGRGFLRACRIKRELRCDLRIIIESDSGGALQDMQNLTINYSDQIDPSQTSFVKSRDIPELAPAFPGSRWSRFVEPALVTVAVGTLVYLFFANR
jgi:hypothetical protein